MMMKKLSLFGILVIACVIITGCEPEEQYHARMLGGQLRSLYRKWNDGGRSSEFVVTNHIYVGWTTNQFFLYTNKAYANGEQYQCRFAIRDSTRFVKPGLLAITDDNVLLWIGDNGTIVVNPDARRWSSE
jgi:hypothetical protein